MVIHRLISLKAQIQQQNQIAENQGDQIPELDVSGVVMEQQDLKQLLPPEQAEVLQKFEYISAGQSGGSRPQSGSCRKGKRYSFTMDFSRRATEARLAL